MIESALLVQDEAGWLLRDRFLLRSGRPWDAAGLAGDAPYFATVALFGDGPWDTLPDDVDAAVFACPGVQVAGGPLDRRGAVIRCLAKSAVALGDAVDRLWAMARRRLLDCPPLPLRKL